MELGWNGFRGVSVNYFLFSASVVPDDAKSAEARSSSSSLYVCPAAISPPRAALILVDIFQPLARQLSKLRASVMCEPSSKDLLAVLVYTKTWAASGRSSTSSVTVRVFASSTHEHMDFILHPHPTHLCLEFGVT